jgi:hypothetical protein
MKVKPHRTIRMTCILLVALSMVLGSCVLQKDLNMEKNKKPDPVTERGTQIISAPIVSQNFVDKRGRKTDRREMYVQRSIQNYFIKFCESKVSQEELEQYLAEKGDLMKVATLEVEFRDGAWDICDENAQMQSRMGEYIIIHRIVKK